MSHGYFKIRLVRVSQQKGENKKTTQNPLTATTTQRVPGGGDGTTQVLG